MIGAKKGPVLLVTQQVNSNLRQTFFMDGKMISSRQSVINQDAANISNIGKFAWPEVDKTLTFIRNQQQIEDTDRTPRQPTAELLPRVVRTCFRSPARHR